MTATLTIINGCRVGDVFTLTDEQTIVGRQPSCDLVLPTESISRRHARFLRRDDAVYVEDLGSRNGTFVNGRKVSAPLRLAEGDQIHLFDVALVFRANATAVEGEPSESLRPLSSLLEDRLSEIVTGETVAEVDIAELGIGQECSNPETKLKAVVELTRNLQRGFDVDQLSPQILESVLRIFPQAGRGALFFADSPTQELRPGAIQHREEDNDNPATMPPLNQLIPRQVFRTGKALMSVEPAEEGLGDSTGELVLDGGEVVSFMCAPLIGPSNHPCGSIYVDAREAAGRFSKDDLDVLATVAFLAGQVIEQLFLHTARYHAVVNTAADGVITVDAAGTIESVNPAIGRLFGYPAEELVGRNVRLLMPELGQADGSDGNLFGFGGETAGCRKDGSSLPIHVSGGEFELDGQRHFTGILRDITQRKRYETELKRLNQTLEQRVQERTEHVRLLQDVAVIANEAESVEAALQAALLRICRHMGWPVGHVYLRSRKNPEEFVDTGIWALHQPRNYRSLVDASHRSVFHSGEGTVGRVIAHRRAEWNVNLTEDSELVRKNGLLECGIRASLAFPLLMGEEIVGVVEFFSTEAVEPDSGFLNVMNHVGTQLGRVVERRHLQEELIDAVWQQQRRFGQELHDSLGQQLTGIGMMLSSLSRKLRAEDHPAAGRLTELTGMVQQAKEEARKLSKGMYPVDVDAQGLRAALEDLAATTRTRYEVECVFLCEPCFEVRDNNAATHLFRIAQEAVTNSAKHARPSRIVVSLATRGEELILAVADDGEKERQEPKTNSPGMGMRIMRYRANLIGATLEVESNARGGTTVRCVVGRRKP